MELHYICDMSKEQNPITYEHDLLTYERYIRGAILLPGAILHTGVNLHQGANCAFKRGLRCQTELFEYWFLFEVSSHTYI